MSYNDNFFFVLNRRELAVNCYNGSDVFFVGTDQAQNYVKAREYVCTYTRISAEAAGELLAQSFN
jgi:hypothetical protein